MAELFGAIERGLGMVLNGIYEAVPSYAFAIVVLTVASRLLLMPLTVKQMRSMRVMQKLQPQLKEIQKKYKEQQRKVKDRREVQELRLKQNQEVSALFRAHHANPAGGCLPLLAQFPVFIALFAVMRATVFMVAFNATTLIGGPIPADTYTAAEREATICSPGSVSGEQIALTCETQVEGEDLRTESFLISDLQETGGGGEPLADSAVDRSLIARCNPIMNEDESATLFACTSTTGTGHLPRDGELFAAVNQDRATILGMHPGCSPSQARSEIGLKRCTAEQSDTGLLAIAPYFLLVLAIAGTQYFSGKQMMARQSQQGGQMQQQAAMMTKIMPVFFGFISLNFPTGLNWYYLTFNIWQIGQQHVILSRLDHEEKQEEAGKAKPRKKGLMARARDSMEAQMQARQAGSTDTAPEETDEGQAPPQPGAPQPGAPQPGAPQPGVGAKPHPRSKKKKKRKRR